MLSVTGGTVRSLYGSPLPTHEGVIALRIFPSAETYDNGVRRYSPATNMPMIEVFLSKAQFAELITTWNVYGGVPCTIKSINGAKVQGYSANENELTDIQNEFEGDLSNLVETIRTGKATIADLLDKSKMAKKDQAEVLRIFSDIERQVRSNLPYMTSCFAEAATKIVSHAKTEVANFIARGVAATKYSLFAGSDEVPTIEETHKSDQ